MSFILDALRKSDSRRQQSGAPGINSPEPPRTPRRRRRRLLPWLAAGLLLFAVAASALYVLRPEWLPARLTPTELAEVSDDGAATTRTAAETNANPNPAADPAEAPTMADRPSQPDDPSDPAEGREMPSKPPADDGEARRESEARQDDSDGADRRQVQRDRRRPIPASPERTVRREAPPRESEPVSSEEATKELGRRLAEEARRRREAPAEPPRSEADSRPAERAGAEPSNKPEPASTPKKPKALNEGVAEYVRAWELPLSVRRSLPEMNLSIHVFSPNEGERFVLINGERYVPGDEIGDARIVDISRDGAIVDFRSHRFLLEPR